MRKKGFNKIRRFLGYRINGKIIIILLIIIKDGVSLKIKILFEKT
jgi:hypothetical protein